MPHDQVDTSLSPSLHATPDHSIDALRTQLVQLVGRLDDQAVVYLWRLVTWWVSPRRRDGPPPHEGA